MAYIKNDWKNGDVITADKLNHMEDGIGSGTQADYEQNDNTAPDYIKNRPFYSGMGEQEGIVDEEFLGSGSWDVAMQNMLLECPITIHINNDEWTFNEISIDSYEDGDGTHYGAYLGAPWTGDQYDFSTYPFELFFGTKGDGVDFNETAEHVTSIQIYDTTGILAKDETTYPENTTHLLMDAVTEVVHQIDSKYIPRPHLDINMTLNDSVLECDVTLEELIDAIKNNMLLNIDANGKKYLNCRGSLSTLAEDFDDIENVRFCIPLEVDRPMANMVIEEYFCRSLYDGDYVDNYMLSKTYNNGSWSINYETVNFAQD